MRNGSDDEYGARLLARLREADPQPRADMVRVLERTARHLTEVWRRRRGVPMLMVYCDGPHAVRVERIGMRELSAYGYSDEFHRWSGIPAHEKAQEHGCAALVYGDRVHARFNRIGPIGSPRFAPDTFASVILAHRDARHVPAVSFPFTVRGRVAPRLVFPPSLYDALARAREV
jgi:hypothetical protein